MKKVILVVVFLLFCSMAYAVPYTMIDLGTLGGNVGDVSYGKDISESGQIVGYGDTGLGDTHGILWENGVTIDIGTLGRGSWAHEINKSGQIAGQSYSIPYSNMHAFLYENSVMTDIGDIGEPRGINDSGQIITVSSQTGYYNAFLYDNGVMLNIGTLGGFYAAPNAINNSGQIVGYSRTTSDEDHAFLYENGVMIDLGTLGGNYSEASGINNNSQIVGTLRTSSGSYHAFLYENDVMVDLGLSGDSFPRAINDMGQIVGKSNNKAFVWDATNGLQFLGGLWSEAVGINNSGQIVGWHPTSTGENHAVLWQPTIPAAEPIPEPTTFALLGIGLSGLTGVALRRRLKRAIK